MNVNSEIYSFAPSQTNIKLASCVLVLDSKNRLLLTRRTKTSYIFPSCWVNPGGRVDAGESFEQCALREVEEEVGIKLEKKIRSSSPDPEYSYSGADCQFKPFLVYESVYPTHLELGLPKVQNLILFYYLRIGLENSKIKIKTQEEEVDKAIWIHLETLKNVLEDKLNNTEEVSCFTLSQNGYPVNDIILKDHLEGVFPNSIKEGLGEGHLKAVQYFINSKYGFSNID